MKNNVSGKMNKILPDIKRIQGPKSLESKTTRIYHSQKVLVRFKFKENKVEHQEQLTKFQYENMKLIKNIEYCEII